MCASGIFCEWDTTTGITEKVYLATFDDTTGLLSFDKNTFLFNFNLNLLSNLSKKKFPLIAKKAEISFLENKDSFSKKEWKNLYKLSENTFVDETESLKQGAAGAGLTDND